jgi:hypothetical protein
MKDIIQMTINSHTSNPIPAADTLPMAVWQHGAATRSSPFPHWHLLIGAEVEIRRYGRLLGTGVVDNATSSGDIAWIAADGINSRTMIEKSDGYELSIGPSTQLQPGPAVHGK